MTPEQVADLLATQRHAARIASHVTQLQGIRSTQGRRLYIAEVPADIRDDVKAAYLAWHAQQQEEAK